MPKSLHLNFLFPLLILFFSSPVSPILHGGNKYSKSIINATQLPAFSNYDYIIVGGGTSGCALASTLAKYFKVLLLERGGNKENYPQIATQDGFLQILSQAHNNNSNTHDSPAQPFISLEGVPNLRGRVLGGSSSVNAGFYSRAGPGFFQTGPVWDMGLVNASYQWVEKALVSQPKPNKWQVSVTASLLQANLTPFNGFSFEHLVGTKIGGTTFGPDGRRRSAADLLSLTRLPNLFIALHATVEKILLDTVPGGSGKLSAKGVTIVDSMQRRHFATTRPNGEVILCAGALGSPQLLLLSGIGPIRALKSLGIPILRPNRFVGKFLFDNPRNGITIVSPIPLENSLIQVVGISDAGFFIEAATNSLPFFFLPHPFFLHGPISTHPLNLNLTLATLMEKVAGPLSAGEMWLASTNVRDNPIVRFNYFAKWWDMRRCVAGMRRIGVVLRSPEMEQFKFPKRFGGRGFVYVGAGMPMDESDDAQMRDFCRRTLSTIWHYHGGCKVGKVVDPEYRVFGVDSLRVVDGSTFAFSPGTNPQATVMMLGRYMGLRLMKERWNQVQGRNIP